MMNVDLHVIPPGSNNTSKGLVIFDFSTSVFILFGPQEVPRSVIKREHLDAFMFFASDGTSSSEVVHPHFTSDSSSPCILGSYPSSNDFSIPLDCLFVEFVLIHSKSVFIPFLPDSY